ncbi:collagen alpha-1(III) chain-like [Mustela nigripes]|uniref:collagen alpha-1(III) chain-like n=1 Tax=Mustela nigripes TaxID=77151 RepID=UPI0028156D47|nr:collagen alpha-1(III) chain-like [Mustela nigripes]
MHRQNGQDSRDQGCSLIGPTGRVRKAVLREGSCQDLRGAVSPEAPGVQELRAPETTLPAPGAPRQAWQSDAGARCTVPAHIVSQDKPDTAQASWDPPPPPSSGAPGLVPHHGDRGGGRRPAEAHGGPGRTGHRTGPGRAPPASPRPPLPSRDPRGVLPAGVPLHRCNKGARGHGGPRGQDSEGQAAAPRGTAVWTGAEDGRVQPWGSFHDSCSPHQDSRARGGTAPGRQVVRPQSTGPQLPWSLPAFSVRDSRAPWA